MTVEWSVPLGQTRSITIALHAVAIETRAVHGCLGCSVATDIRHRGSVRYTEDWLTEDDLRARVRSDPFKHLVTLMEDSMVPPRVEFTLLHETRGLDYVAEVRMPEP